MKLAKLKLKIKIATLFIIMSFSEQ